MKTSDLMLIGGGVAIWYFFFGPGQGTLLGLFPATGNAGPSPLAPAAASPSTVPWSQNPANPAVQMLSLGIPAGAATPPPAPTPYPGTIQSSPVPAPPGTALTLDSIYSYLQGFGIGSAPLQTWVNIVNTRAGTNLDGGSTAATWASLPEAWAYMRPLLLQSGLSGSRGGLIYRRWAA
jgi:hypothetical protein